ncbi:PREDICTED: auxin-responsive protein SAUR36-like [Ipomoea nil]|uniref:auxin-responsive protein SAUR36-like n=1 Tax=Ipomoea nil TaxID=35883 RepID=UPI0009014A50|nr:PREDICTED: auxin-responsive protein SAUR36-like [Ipomoea nil]
MSLNYTFFDFTLFLFRVFWEFWGLKTMKMRGFLVKTAVVRRVLRRRRSSTGYRRLNHPLQKRWREKSVCSVFSRLKTKAKAICSSLGWSRSFGRRKAVEENPTVAVPPKGHVAVYVGQKDGDFKRILVPVIYFNHPLFGELLREAENEFGFSHPGGITIPCRISEFELVQTRIKQGSRCRKMTIALK